MASPRPPPPPSSSATPLDLEITVVSAKHLKNVNWRHGDLKPYAVVYLDPDRRSATKPDDSNSTKPVWNERLSIPLPLTHDPSPLLLTLIVFHSKPSEITKSPLVGTAVVPLDDLISVEPGAAAAKALELRRPSGRPQGKLRIKLAIRERPLPPLESNYQLPPPSSYYYSSAPPPPPPSIRDYRTYSPPPPVPQYNPPNLPPSSNYPYGNYADPYYSSNAGYYYSAPPIPAQAQAQAQARTYIDPASGYHCGPSAPVDYSSGSSVYEQKGKGRKFGVGAGLAVGAVTGAALGGLTLEEGLKYEEERIKERVESDHAARDDYSDYRSDY